MLATSASMTTADKHGACAYLKIQRAFGEEVFDLLLLGREALLVRIGDQGLEHVPVGLDAVGEGIGAEQLARLGEIVGAEDEAVGELLVGFLLADRLGLEEGLVEVDRDPGILAIDVAADHVSVVGRNEAMLVEEALALGDAVGKE